MSPADATMVMTMSGFPRVSGDEPFHTAWETQVKEFSPRERG